MSNLMNIKLTETVQLPRVGFGTYLIPDGEAPSVVNKAIEIGYRHIDTAEAYQNERGVGLGIKSAMETFNLSREELFVTTKLWPGNEAWGQQPKTYESTIESLNASLERLQLDYVDLYLIHAPLAQSNRLQQWQALVDLCRQGKTKAIGVSNYDKIHIEEFKSAGCPLPMVNQIELHPWSQKPELVAYLTENGISTIAYSSLLPLSSWRNVAGQDSAKTESMKAAGAREDSPFKMMAQKYGVSEAQVLLRWGLQKGYAVLPKSMNEARMRQNIDLFSFQIDDEDMDAIGKMDRGDGLAWSTGDPSKVE